MKTMKTKGRPGGNPVLVKYQFQKKGEVEMTQSVTFRLTPAQREKAKSIPNLSEKFRAWLDSL